MTMEMNSDAVKIKGAQQYLIMSKRSFIPSKELILYTLTVWTLVYSAQYLPSLQTLTDLS